MKVTEPFGYIPKPGDNIYANLILVGIFLIPIAINAYTSYMDGKRVEEMRREG